MHSETVHSLFFFTLVISRIFDAFSRILYSTILFVLFNRCTLCHPYCPCNVQLSEIYAAVVVVIVGCHYCCWYLLLLPFFISKWILNEHSRQRRIILSEPQVKFNQNGQWMWSREKRVRERESEYGKNQLLLSICVWKSVSACHTRTYAYFFLICPMKDYGGTLLSCYIVRISFTWYGLLFLREVVHMYVVLTRNKVIHESVLCRLFVGRLFFFLLLPPFRRESKKSFNSI